MNRRIFLHGLAALGVAPSLSAFASDAVLPQEPAWALGFASMNEDQLSSGTLPAVGKFPQALRGILYRNGPARHERGGLRYHHWFDGDGMVHAYRFGAQGVSHHARYVHTEKYLDEEQAGRFKRAAFGTIFPGSVPTTSADSVNVANTSVLFHADTLLALWEGGSAYRLDAETLDTLGKKTWREDLAGMPFSAHPKIEPDGTLWNFGTISRKNMLAIYRISASGALQKAQIIPVPHMPMVHDFAITERHLVFLLPPFNIDSQRLASGDSIAQSYVWEPQRGMRILTVDKNDFAKTRMYETDSGFVFHLGNAWEDAQGVIRLSYLRSDDDASFQLGFDVMRGVFDANRARPHLSLMRLDPQTGRVSEEKMPEVSEFPSIDSRHVGRRYRHIVTICNRPGKADFGFDMVQRRDLERGTVDQYHYGADVLAEEHILVPDLSRRVEGAGWVVGTSLDLKKKTTTLSVFDALKLGDGPVAQAYLPYALPLGLHGMFRRQIA